MNTQNHYSHKLKAYQYHDLMPLYEEHATYMSNCINILLEKAKRQGTHLILEGGFILPQIVGKNKDIVFYIQAIKNEDFFKERIKSTLLSTHLKRPISSDDIPNVIKINNYLINKAIENKVKVIYNDYCIEKTIETALDFLTEKIKKFIKEIN